MWFGLWWRLGNRLAVEGRGGGVPRSLCQFELMDVKPRLGDGIMESRILA